MGNAVKILALEGHAHVLLLRSPNETVVHFRHKLLMSRCVWINILNAGIISVWRIVLIGIPTRTEGQHKQERKQERKYSFCQFVNLLSRISCGGGGGVLADRLAGVFYFKILNLPIMGSSFALPFSALMMPMTARTVITMLRMGAMIHPRMGMIQSTDEISPHRNSTSP